MSRRRLVCITPLTVLDGADLLLGETLRIPRSLLANGSELGCAEDIHDQAQLCQQVAMLLRDIGIRSLGELPQGSEFCRGKGGDHEAQSTHRHCAGKPLTTQLR